MGIVNVTPDSFSDGGRHVDTRGALRHCEQLIKDGADILDIGGESTRPGSPAVPLEQELARVVPLVVEAVRLGVPVSVDTYKPQVMQAVLDLGADIVNDIWALRQPGAAGIVAAHPRCGVCLMHMHRDPQTMQATPMEEDVVPSVLYFLERSAQELQALGVERPASYSTMALGSARQSSKISPCWPASPSSWPWATRCWPAGRANRPSVPSLACLCTNAWHQALPRPCLPWSAVRGWCVCMTYARPWRRWRCGARCGSRTPAPPFPSNQGIS